MKSLTVKSMAFAGIFASLMMGTERNNSIRSSQPAQIPVRM